MIIEYIQKKNWIINKICMHVYIHVGVGQTKHIFISYLFEKWKKSAQNKVGDFVIPLCKLSTRGVINSIP